MMNRTAKNVIAIIFAFLFLVILVSPLFLTINHQAKLLDNGAVKISENGELFVYPQECWLLTTFGIVTSCLLILLLVIISFIWSRIFRDFPLLLWLVIAVSGGVLIQIAGRTTYYEHKEDYILISKKELCYKLKNKYISIPFSDIKSITHEDRGFVIIYKDYKELRISDVMVSKLYGHELLSKRLKTLMVKYSPENIP